MANGVQYIELPDGSYGKFDANASDDVIRGALQKDFPDHFRSTQSPIQPPGPAIPGLRRGVGMEPADRPVGAEDLAMGAIGPPARLARTGYQTMVKGITGRPYLGEPQSTSQTLSDATNVGLGMAIGGMEGGGAAEAAPEASAPRGVTTRSGGPRVSGAAPGAPPGSGSGSSFAADMLDLAKPKWMKAAQILKKHLGGGEPAASGAGAGAGTLPHELAGKGIYGTPVEQWGQRVEEPPPPPKVARPQPAWQRAAERDPWANLQHDRTATTQAMGESKAGKLPPGFTVVQRAQQIKEGLIKGAGTSGARPATEVPTPKQVTPDTKAGDTVRMVESEHNRLDRNGGQFGQPTAVGKLQRSNAKPTVGLSKLEQKQSQMKLRNRLKKVEE